MLPFRSFRAWLSSAGAARPQAGPIVPRGAGRGAGTHDDPGAVNLALMPRALFSVAS
jgi:hypothetical protein